MKKYDGLGFANTFQTHCEPQYHMANLSPPGAFTWPPQAERTVARDITLICPDIRTAAVFRLEAFDLSEKGFNPPYFRRQMSILDRVGRSPDIDMDGILVEFTKEERENIYPPLVMEMLAPLVEELTLLKYLEVTDGKFRITDKGSGRLATFNAGLSEEERIALRLA